MYSRSTRSRCPWETIRIRSRHSRRALPTQRSACAFARGVAITDQDARTLPLPVQRCEDVACLLRHPSTVGMGGDAGDVHPLPLELDEEEDVETTQPNGVDGEEVAFDDPGRLLA